ncbi:MAG: hypothetical protein KDK64_05145 [Chlamydiia bacterium]|nr:hypothetical protein [Chlamydiia bacterium]
MFSILGPRAAAAGGTFFPFFRRGFATVSNQTLKELPKQEVTISQPLRERLVARMREEAAKKTPDPLKCNCLPGEGPEFEKMAENAFSPLLKRCREAIGHH